MAKAKPSQVRIVIGLPPWRRSQFEVYNEGCQHWPDSRYERYAKAARENGWRHVQVVRILPSLSAQPEGDDNE